MRDLAPGLTLLAGGEDVPYLRYVPPFSPRPPWLGGDLQTLRNKLVPGPYMRFSTGKRLEIPLRTAGTGRAEGIGRLSAVLDRGQGRRTNDAPLILLVHGLGGCEDSAYMQLMAGGLLEDGYDVLRLNLRGAGPSARTSRGPYHAGLTVDLRDVLVWLRQNEGERPVVAIGFSLGGHMLLRLAGEGGDMGCLAGIMTVCAPVDLFAVQERIAAGRNRLYHAALVHWMKQDARAWLPPDSPLMGSLPSLDTIRAFDAAIVAPVHGFSSVDAYYHDASMQRVSSRIAMPVLAVHSDDDPWIPLESYRRTDWPHYSGMAVLVTKGGGHVGFHGRGSRLPWYISTARIFIDAI